MASDEIKIIPLGSGQEVGRSCVVAKLAGKTVMFDCGVHPAYSGYDSLPYFDTNEIDIGAIDICLVTHYHLDHCGATPYLTSKTAFKGQVFMTPATKSLFKLVMQDFIRVSTGSAALFQEEDLESTLEKVKTIDYHQQLEVEGIKFTCYNAGHVLGAAMFMVELGGKRILYTGDYSRAPDRHLRGAETPTQRPDILIVESTYGIAKHEKRESREERFTGTVNDIIQRGGRCLVPVFALGRAQELLLIIEEYWSKHPELQQFPVYYASSLAQKCMGIFETFIHHMNNSIVEQSNISNPFQFKHIHSLQSLDDFQDTGPCVVLASPGMLQNGVSRELFDLWCSNSKNGLILAGYSVEGTLAKRIATARPKEVERLRDSKRVPLRMTSEEISFSAHSDYHQTQEFIRLTQPSHVVLVHGDSSNMLKLKERLGQEFHDQKLAVFAPHNTATVTVNLRRQIEATVMGKLATAPVVGDVLRGVLVSKDLEMQIVDESEVSRYTELQATKVISRIKVPLPAPMHIDSLLRSLHKYFQTTPTSTGEADATSTDEDALLQLISQMQELLSSDAGEDNGAFLKLTPEVKVVFKLAGEGRAIEEVSVEWSMSRFHDLVADVVILALLHMHRQEGEKKRFGEVPMRSIRQTGSDSFTYNTMRQMLQLQYGTMESDLDIGEFKFYVEEQLVVVRAPFSVECENQELLTAVAGTMRRIYFAITPITFSRESWCHCED